MCVLRSFLSRHITKKAKRGAAFTTLVVGGGLVLFAVHKTKTTINHIVRSEALDVENNRCEYIYIQDPDFHTLYEASLHSQGHEGRSWLRSPTHWLQWWRKTRAWRLLALAQSEDQRDRLQAVQDLASLTHLTDSDCKQLAQACDVRTAVGLARTPGVDLRLFLGAPYAHITSNKQELVKCMRALLTAVDRKCEHPCLQDFLSKAFPELQVIKTFVKINIMRRLPMAKIPIFFFFFVDCSISPADPGQTSSHHDSCNIEPSLEELIRALESPLHQPSNCGPPSWLHYTNTLQHCQYQTNLRGCGSLLATSIVPHLRKKETDDMPELDAHRMQCSETKELLFGAHLKNALLELDLSTLEVPPPFISEDELLRASVESLLHHSSLRNNGEELINLGAIPLLMELYQHYSCDEAMQIQLCKLVSNLSLVEGSLQQLFMAGFVGVLAKWCSHSNIRLSAPSVQALSNMDSDQTMGGRYHPHIYLLHPTTRQHAPAHMDVVFIHGLLGGVFITWRQRDNTTCTLVVESERVKLGCPGSVTNHDDGQALATGKASSSDSSIKAYLEVMDEVKEEEWESLLEDYELVMADCPQGANEQGTGPFCLRDRHHCAPLASVCWPRDWLPKDCPNLRVIGVNYDTAISSWASLCPQEQECHTLDQRSEELLKRLCRAGLGQRPLMWVGHSMGGLLVKSILVKAWQSSDPELEGIWRNTRAVAFYSVPHRGSPLAALRQTTQFLLWPSTEVQELRQDSPALLALHQKFLDLLGAVSIDVVSFAETKSTFIPSLRLEFDFVPPQSARIGKVELEEVNPLLLVLSSQAQHDKHVSQPCHRGGFFYLILISLPSDVSRNMSNLVKVGLKPGQMQTRDKVWPVCSQQSGLGVRGLVIMSQVIISTHSLDPGVGEFYEIPQDHLSICKPANSDESTVGDWLLCLF
uniref:Protein SERAC1 n=1 Tax=Timema californicum TaxID=61474 RepID=A0A7R9J361_TIMCA|nr:unnamed protein product [Timema californicum]